MRLELRRARRCGERLNCEQKYGDDARFRSSSAGLINGGHNLLPLQFAGRCAFVGGNCPSDFTPQAGEGCYADATAMIAVANRCRTRSIGLLFAGLLFFTGFQGLAVAAGNESVLVEIFESVPDETNWNFAPTKASESYNETAFGFSSMPTRYSNKGIKVDRGAPFLFRASATVNLPSGERRVLLRARTGARLFMDGKLLLTTPFPKLLADGHEEVPEAPLPLAPTIRYLQPGHFEAITNLVCDGTAHTFVLEAIIGSKGRRPELGELTVSVETGKDTFVLLSPDTSKTAPLSDEGWDRYAARRRTFWKVEDAKQRRLASAGEAEYWEWRHEEARKVLARMPGIRSKDAGNEIDRFIKKRLAEVRGKTAPMVDDWSFL